MKVYIVLLLLITLFTLSSCNHESVDFIKKGGSSSVFDSISCKTEYKEQKILVNISFLKNGKWYQKDRQFVKTGGFYSEKYAIKHSLEEKADTIFIPIFICKDTSFKKTFDYNQSNIMAPPGFYDWSYNIKMQSDGLFMLVRQNLTDTTWKEFFWYDKDFVIKRMEFLNGGDTLNISL